MRYPRRGFPSARVAPWLLTPCRGLTFGARGRKPDLPFFGLAHEARDGLSGSPQIARRAGTLPRAAAMSAIRCADIGGLRFGDRGTAVPRMVHPSARLDFIAGCGARRQLERAFFV